MESDSIEKKGQSLSGVSSAIIVYILAGGEILESGNLFGTSIKITNSWVIEVSILILLLYLAYRYFMSRPYPFRDFDKQTRIYVADDKRFNKFMKKFAEANMKNAKPFRGNDFPVEAKWHKNPKAPVQIDTKSGQYSVRLQLKYETGENANDDFPMNKLEFWRYSIKTVLYREAFWVIFLPWILFVFASLLVVMRIGGINFL